MGKIVQNEQIKLFAGFCNTVAAAILITGLIGPLFTIVYGLGDRHFDAGIIAVGSLICAPISCGLHLTGRLILTGMIE